MEPRINKMIIVTIPRTMAAITPGLRGVDVPGTKPTPFELGLSVVDGVAEVPPEGGCLSGALEGDANREGPVVLGGWLSVLSAERTEDEEDKEVDACASMVLVTVTEVWLTASPRRGSLGGGSFG